MAVNKAPGYGKITVQVIKNSLVPAILPPGDNCHKYRPLSLALTCSPTSEKLPKCYRGGWSACGLQIPGGIDWITDLFSASHVSIRTGDQSQRTVVINVIWHLKENDDIKLASWSNCYNSKPVLLRHDRYRIVNSRLRDCETLVQNFETQTLLLRKSCPRL